MSSPNSVNSQSTSSSIALKKISIIVFGTNQYYETPKELIMKFIQSQKVDNFSQKKESKISFDLFINQSEKVSIHLIFINNLDTTYKICKEADAQVIFFDIESIDSLDKLSNIITYIKESCRCLITTTHIYGKYNNPNDKITSISLDKMNDYLKEKNIGYTYQELNTADEIDVVNNLRTMLFKAFESHNKISNIKASELKAFKMNSTTPNQKNNDDNSKSQCVIF